MYLNSDSLLEQSITQLVSENFPPTETLLHCFSHLITIVSNLLEKPNDPKFKIIKRANEKISREVLFFPQALQILYLMGFEDLEVDGECNLFYTAGLENNQTLNQTLKILRNKQKNEFSVLNFQSQKTEMTPMDLEVMKRKKEIEETKEMKEKLIRDFEADKKFNLEVRKSLPSDQNTYKIPKRPNYRNSGSLVGSENDDGFNKNYVNYENAQEIPKKFKKTNIKGSNNLGTNKVRKVNGGKKPKNNIVTLKSYESKDKYD